MSIKTKVRLVSVLHGNSIEYSPQRAAVRGSEELELGAGIEGEEALTEASLRDRKPMRYSGRPSKQLQRPQILPQSFRRGKP